MKKNKKTVIIISAVLIVFVLSGSFILKTTLDKAVAAKALAEAIAADFDFADRIYQESGIRIAGTINGEPFLQEDLYVYEAELRAMVAAHYGRVYNIRTMGASFWDTEYDGITPKEFLKELAVKDLTRNMVLIQQARIRGIDTPETYSDLELERQAWNSPTDEIIYGPRTLGRAEYNSYRITRISDALKTDLLNNELKPTNAQLRASYDSLPQSLKAALFRASGIRFFWDGEENADDNIDSILNKEICTAIEISLKQGLSPDEITSSLSVLYPGFSWEEFEVNSRYIAREDDYEQDRAELFRHAPAGSFIPGPENSPSFYHITAKEGGGYYTFEEAPGLGRNKWINDQFEIFLEKHIKSSRITLF